MARGTYRKSPCGWDCPKRSSTCHGECPEYLAYYAERREENKNKVSEEGPRRFHDACYYAHAAKIADKKKYKKFIHR